MAYERVNKEVSEKKSVAFFFEPYSRPHREVRFFALCSACFKYLISDIFRNSKVLAIFAVFYWVKVFEVEIWIKIGST